MSYSRFLPGGGAVALLLAGLAARAPAQQRFERVSVDSNGAEANGTTPANSAILSADGRYVLFDSYASNLAPYDLNHTVDVFVHDRTTGKTVMISTALTGLAGNNASFAGGISADGRFVAFGSSASDLVKYDTNQTGDAFVRDRDPDGNGVFDEGNETTARVSVDANGSEANGYCYFPAISADGTQVAFGSDATNLVAGDTNGTGDVFVHDMATGAIERVSVTTLGLQSNGYSGQPQLSSDGALVCFSSSATNLVAKDTNARQDIFVRDRAAAVTTRVSIHTSGKQADGDCYDPSFSSDGGKVAWWSYATTLVDGDTNNYYDVFLRDVAAGTTVRLDVSPLGVEGDLGANSVRLAPSGDFAVFSSNSTNLAGVETNHTGDAFLADLNAGTLKKVSVHPSGKEGDGYGFGYAVSDDGQIVAMSEGAFDLIGSDANNISDILVRNLAVSDPEASWSLYGAGWPGTLGIPNFTPEADPVLGTTLTLDLDNSVGFFTVGFVFIGLSQASIPAKDATLLVDPMVLEPILVPTGGTRISGSLELDDALCGVHVYLQALEIDPGASRGVSFTAGLDLSLGQ